MESAANKSDHGEGGHEMKQEQEQQENNHGEPGDQVKRIKQEEETEKEAEKCETDQQQQQQQQMVVTMDQQTDIYRELILRHLIADISGTCAKLGLSTDLGAWSGDDCRRWVAEMCAQFQLSVPSSDAGTAFAGLDGRRLLVLSVDEFQARFPDGGDTLHAQLQLWKTAFECCGQPIGGSVQQPQPSQSRSAGEGASCCWLAPNESPPAGSGGFVCSSSASSSSSSCSSYNHPTPQYYSNNHHHHQNGAPFGGAANPAVHNESHTHNFVAHSHPNGAMMTGECSSDCSISSSSSSALPDDSSSVADDEFMSVSSGMYPASVADHGHHPQHNNPNNFFVPPPFAASSGPLPEGAAFGEQYLGGGGQFHAHGQQIVRAVQQHSAQPSAAYRLVPSHGSGGTIHLWHFIRELLEQPQDYAGCVRWVDRKEGTFKIESSHHLARYWGLRKNRAAMNYDKLSRSLRQYYKKGIIQKPEKKQRLVYKFMPPYNQ